MNTKRNLKRVVLRGEKRIFAHPVAAAAWSKFVRNSVSKQNSMQISLHNVKYLLKRDICKVSVNHLTKGLLIHKPTPVLNRFFFWFSSLLLFCVFFSCLCIFTVSLLCNNKNNNNSKYNQSQIVTGNQPRFLQLNGFRRKNPYMLRINTTAFNTTKSYNYTFM